MEYDVLCIKDSGIELRDVSVDPTVSGARRHEGPKTDPLLPLTLALPMAATPRERPFSRGSLTGALGLYR